MKTHGEQRDHQVHKFLPQKFTRIWLIQKIAHYPILYRKFSGQSNKLAISFSKRPTHGSFKSSLYWQKKNLKNAIFYNETSM